MSRILEGGVSSRSSEIGGLFFVGGKGDSADVGDGTGVEDIDDPLMLDSVFGIQGDQGVGAVGVGHFLEALEDIHELGEVAGRGRVQRGVVEKDLAAGLDHEPLLIGDVEGLLLGDGAGQRETDVAFGGDRFRGDEKEHE